jgi:hypothetical protein
MKLDTGESVVHETIYRYIYDNKANGGQLYKSLRHKNRKYHKRSNDYKARGTIIDRVMMDKRPKIVEEKSRIGDLEIDTWLSNTCRSIFRYNYEILCSSLIRCCTYYLNLRLNISCIVFEIIFEVDE